MIGQTISHYTISEKLGEGGMGVVYKAEDTKLKRTVALKFLPPHLSASEQDKARFIQEAQSASAINHPNICTIHDIQEHESQMFIVMEYVEGQTLRARLESANVNLKAAIEMGIQIADGLAAAHERGIVHRDIKPENIMVRKDGIAQIMDFGLAKLHGVSRLTKEGSTVGTAGYMSPEQVQGIEADHRSDIFSLGVLLYEMFSGQPPFKGVHETALMYEIVNVDAAPASTVNKEIDPALDAIVLECLAKEPDERYQSAKEVSKELKRFKRESGKQRVSRISRVRPVSARIPAEHDIVPGEKSRPVVLFALLGVLSTAVLVLAYFQFFAKGQGTERTIRFPLTPPQNVSIVNSIVVSPDGKSVVFSGRGQGKILLWLRPLDSVTPHPLNGTEGAEHPFWSPDGRFIGFFADGKLKRVDLNGSIPTSICDAANGRGGTWNAAGLIVFSPNTDGPLYQVASAGGEPKQLTTIDTLGNEFEHVWPFFLPDGDHFLYSGRKERDHDNPIYLASLASGTRKEVTRSVANVMYAPPGLLVFVKEQSLFAQRFDVDEGKVNGDPVAIAGDVGYVPLTGEAAFSVSRNGVLATGGGRDVNRELTWFDRSGKGIGVLGAPGNFFDIVLSPDGKRVAAQLWDQLGGNSDISVLDIVRNQATRFTFATTAEDDPIWSPGGKWIGFSSTKDGPPGVYRKLSTGAGSDEALHVSAFPEFPSDWSPDGKFILYQRQDPRTKFDLWVLPVDRGLKPVPVAESEYNEWNGKFSPDGRWIAYSSNESGRYEVYIRSFTYGEQHTAIGKWQISTNGGGQPQWRKDGRELYYISPDKSLMAVPVKSASSFEYGTPLVLFRTEVDNFDAPNRFAPANDGQRFLINVPMEEVYTSLPTITVNWTAELTEKQR
ncbi:MAG: protein kinase [Ignavibacteria bacterium]|nr:protein kinase [Ignavibacteria bacterium]